MPPSPPLFLAALFGPGLEEEALARHREGIPYLQVLDATCAIFLEELCKTVCIPGRVGSQLRRILAFQPSLHRMPPRRPSSLIGRPEFTEAMTYFYLSVKTREENRPALEWWQAFIKTPAAMLPAPSADQGSGKTTQKKAAQTSPCRSNCRLSVSAV